MSNPKFRYTSPTLEAAVNVLFKRVLGVPLVIDPTYQEPNFEAMLDAFPKDRPAPLILKEGCRYRTRNGLTTGPLAPRTSTKYPFFGTVDGILRYWTAEGRWKHGDTLNNRPFDLIEVYEGAESATELEERFQRWYAEWKAVFANDLQARQIFYNAQPGVELK